MVKCPQIILIDACTKWPSHSRQRFQLNCFNTFRPRQNGRHFADDTFKRIFVNENVRISINISLTFVPKGLINNIPALVQIMAWRRPGDRPLSEPMMVNLLTHICVTRPQWVKETCVIYFKFHWSLFLEARLTINLYCFVCEVKMTSWRGMAFLNTCSLWEESIDHRHRPPPKRASNVEIWYFRWRKTTYGTSQYDRTSKGIPIIRIIK